MKKVIIAPDSFKGVLSAGRVADIIADEVYAVFPDCEIIKMPIADGGEGSVETIISAVGGDIFETQVLSPDDREITAFYGITSGGTAVLEMAQSSGLTRQTGLNPMTSTTYGFGQLILAALDKGVRDLILCIGGSATTDGGCGMAAALGVKFFDAEWLAKRDYGDCFIPCGGTLSAIDRIDINDIDKRIAESTFTVMCDVDNPLFGIRGAAYIYGPQKGASTEQVQILDAGLKHYSSVLKKHFGKGFADIPGAGAAGGLGAGCIAFLNAELMSGIDAILNICGFSEHIKNAGLVITGEGKLDSQSFQGKVLSGILRETLRIRSAGDVPILSVCGICELDEVFLREKGVIAFETSEGISVEESMNDCERYLRNAARRAVACCPQSDII